MPDATVTRGNEQGGEHGQRLARTIAAAAESGSMSVATPQLMSTDRVVDDLLRLADAGSRVLAGLTGPPAAGKSTLAQAIAAGCIERGLSTVVVPMDGFHLAQSVLDARGEADIKGAPQTFDADGYVALLRRLRANQEPVWAPRFDRDLEDPIAGAIGVPTDVRLVLTEGNYLLLPTEPWDQVRPLLDRIYYVDAPQQLRQSRLVHRHEQFGRPHQEAVHRALGSDERNARLVAQTRDRADSVIPVD